MANLSNINNKFLVTTGGNVLIGQTSAVGSSIFQVTGASTLGSDVTMANGNVHIHQTGADYLTYIDFIRSSANANPTARIHVTEPAATHTSRMEFYTSNASGSVPNLRRAMFLDQNLKAYFDGTIETVGSITIGTGNSSIQGDLYFDVNADIFKNSGTLKISTVEGIEYQVRSANGSSGDHIFKSYNTAILTLNGATNNSTFTGQVTTSQPNSGLDYPILIGLGTLGSAPIGYQTREQFNNATLQKWYNVDAANAGSSQWVKLGTLSNFGQGGYTFCLTFFGHTGYNANNAQDYNCKLFMKTSNGGGSGARFNTWVENTGANASSPAFKLINTDSSGTPTVGGSSFEIYMNVPAYANGSIYAINKWGGDWTSQNTTGQTDPGADSSTVLQAKNIFNILNTNVGIGTVSPGAFKLSVQHTAEDLLRLHNSTDGLDSLISFTNPGGTLGRVQGIDNGGLAFDTGNNAGGINSNAMFIDNAGKVGIGITNPQDKLHVNGDAIISSTRHGDFSVGSLNTTGYAIANVAASTNGSSAIVEFVASGGSGAYYNVVYSCYNGGGAWYYTKNVVGSGGNIEVAETNGSGSSALVFWFRSTSGSAAYTPRVMMKASPYNLVTL